MRITLLIVALLVSSFAGCGSANLFRTRARTHPSDISNQAILADDSKSRGENHKENSGSDDGSTATNRQKINVDATEKTTSTTIKTAQVAKVSPQVSSAVSPVSFVQELPIEGEFGAEVAVSNVPISVAPGPQTEYETVQYDTGMSAPGVGGNSFPIDLPTVLQLAGADNWSVKIARERVCEAQANYQEARAAWLPSLNFGVGFNHHDGQIQATPGDVIEASRSSLFVGGGAAIANMPLAGGSGGPLRLVADLSIAEAIYQPLAARQLVDAERNANSRIFDDVMLASSLAYFDLVQAQSQLAIAMRNQQDAIDVDRLTKAFVQAGKGTDADSSRTQVVVNQAQLRVAERQAAVGLASAELARILQLDSTKLDPSLGIYANEASVAPIHLVDRSLPVGSLVSSALMCRADIAEAEARAQAAQTRAELERVRPYYPHLHFGYSGGAFGGGQGSDLPKLDGRSDVDVQLTWQVRNLGAGNRALKKQRRSQLNQLIYEGRAIKDQIGNEVTTAFHQVNLHGETIQLAESNIAEATNALNKNMLAIKGLEGLPLEAVQSVQALAQSRNEFLDAVMNYNRWQLRLIRAIGQPIAQN